MKLNDRFIGSLTILGGILIFSGTFGFREIPGQQYGSEFFPRIISCFLILIGSAQIYYAQSAPLIVFPEWMTRVATLKAAFLLFMILSWIAFAPVLGFFISTFCLVFILTLVGGGKAVTSLIVSAFATTILYFIFGTLLHVPLPFGYIEGMLI